jgi:AcrR family transcriptional regulator
MVMAIDTPSPPSRPRGRPREFDLDALLDDAIDAFRTTGFAGTSIADLSSATHRTTGSLYKAFRDKRDLFLAAFDRYTSVRREALHAVAEQGKTGRERLQDVLAFHVNASTDAEGRRGCLVVASAVELAAVDDEVRARVDATLAANERVLAAIIRDGRKDGSIAAGEDADTVARVLVCLTQGMRVVGRADRAPPPAATMVALAMKLVE